ncbi:MAG: helix-turn-helix domain-containing protein [Deltaproteobacteria bacterium]|nr:helix-turn-helix domain-containing protein [Deltaproteobacteria bacterium]
MQPTLSGKDITTCSTCFAFACDNPDTFGRGLCLRFEKPNNRQWLDDWPKVKPTNRCEAFKAGNGTRPRVLTLANYPVSAIETCRPITEPPEPAWKRHIATAGDFSINLSKSPTKDESLTTAQVANRLNVTKPYVYYLIDKGRLQAYRAGRGFKVKTEDLETFLQNWKPRKLKASNS